MDNPEKLATQGTLDEEKQTKNTTQYALNITIRKHTPSYKQLDKQNSVLYAEIVIYLTIRNSERKDT